MFRLDCAGRILTIDEPVVMGIINCTPDSFYSGSRAGSIDAIVSKAESMLNEGAMILDIGGQSTRPGSERISADEELARVIKPIQVIRKKFPDTFISIDTFYAKVAVEAVAAGASIVNDISAGAMDTAMIDSVATLKVPYVLVHMKGTPQTMQEQTDYSDLHGEIMDFFKLKLEALRAKGIRDIIVDPGFGFSKTISQNFSLLKNMSMFSELNRPVLLGVSRKSTIYKTLGIGAEQALNGTTVLNTIGLLNGANMLRVHDVKEAAEAIKLFNAYKK